MAMPRSKSRQAIVDYLKAHGSVEDSEGHATAKLKAAVDDTATPTAFTQLVAALERNGTITRSVRGKRTFRIELASSLEQNGPAGPRRRNGSLPAAQPGRTRALPASTSGSIPDGTAGPRTVATGGRSSVGRSRGRSSAEVAHPMRDSEGASVLIRSVDDVPSIVESDSFVDADEIAAALLARVTKLLTAPADSAASWAKRRIAKLEAQVSELEKALARSNSQVRLITEERDELRDRLNQAEANLTLLASRTERHGAETGRSQRRLGPDEQALLRELRTARGQRPEQAV